MAAASMASATWHGSSYNGVAISVKWRHDMAEKSISMAASRYSSSKLSVTKNMAATRSAVIMAWRQSWRNSGDSIKRSGEKKKKKKKESRKASA